MIKALVLSWLLLLLCPCIRWRVAALDNGVALTPPMGFNNFMTQINGTMSIVGAKGLTYIADFLETSGLKDAGYIYINTDEGWELPHRHLTTGELQENTTLFPQGLANFVEGLHQRGFRFGIYGAASAVTCGVMPGQLYHERQDAQTYARTWQIDYLKSDNCATFALDPSVRYRAMRDALNATGRPIVFSIEPFSITPEPVLSSYVANLWRTGNDIQPNFHSILDRADTADKWAPLAGPALGWNDPDMIHLQNPPGLSLGQNRIHFGVWAIMKAPLLLSADLPNLHPDLIGMAGNAEVIAVNQDSLGIAARKIQIDGPPLPWLAGAADCALPEGSLGYTRQVAHDNHGVVRAGPASVDIRSWSLVAFDDESGVLRKLSTMDSDDENLNLLIQHDATGRCLSVWNNSRVVLMPFCSSNGSRFRWRFDKGFSTLTSITNVHAGKALAIADSFLYARQHGKDEQNVTDLAYGTNKLILVDPEEQDSCDSRYCQNYNPKQMWHYSFREKTLQHSLYTSSMNHIERYRDKTHENGWALTPKVPTFRRNCLAHILSEDNTGTEAAASTEVWGGPLDGGDYVLGLVNRGVQALNITARIDLLLETCGNVSPPGKDYAPPLIVDRIRDLWDRRDMDVQDSLDADGNIRFEVPNHDIILLRIHLGEASRKVEHEHTVFS